jgi:putative ABC transport system substrate-binding protein
VTVVTGSKTIALGALLFALCYSASAQQLAKTHRIGYLTASSLTAVSPRIEAFRQGLRELGYVEGKNILIEYRAADGNFDRLPGLATELVRLNVDLIVTGGPAATRPAKDATATIPIVMAQDNDPVKNGFAVSLARPGRNITGLSTIASEISGKRLELLKEIVPNLARVAVFGNTNEPGNLQALKETELAADALKLTIQHLDVRDAKDIGAVFREAHKAGAGAGLILPNSVLTPHRAAIADRSVKARLPLVYDTQFVEAGGLMSYGVSLTDLDRRSAIYVDRILKGAKPADLPIEQPRKFEFIINLKAAKQIDLTIPPNVLARADRVIK